MHSGKCPASLKKGVTTLTLSVGPFTVLPVLVFESEFGDPFDAPVIRDAHTADKTLDWYASIHSREEYIEGFVGPLDKAFTPFHGLRPRL